jgi:hypothetical protein
MGNHELTADISLATLPERGDAESEGWGSTKRLGPFLWAMSDADKADARGRQECLAGYQSASID